MKISKKEIENLASAKSVDYHMLKEDFIKLLKSKGVSEDKITLTDTNTEYELKTVLVETDNGYEHLGDVIDTEGCPHIYLEPLNTGMYTFSYEVEE